MWGRRESASRAVEGKLQQIRELGSGPGWWRAPPFPSRRVTKYFPNILSGPSRPQGWAPPPRPAWGQRTKARGGATPHQAQWGQGRRKEKQQQAGSSPSLQHPPTPPHRQKFKRPIWGNHNGQGEGEEGWWRPGSCWEGGGLGMPTPHPAGHSEMGSKVSPEQAGGWKQGRAPPSRRPPREQTVKVRWCAGGGGRGSGWLGQAGTEAGRMSPPLPSSPFPSPRASWEHKQPPLRPCAGSAPPRVQGGPPRLTWVSVRLSNACITDCSGLEA